MCTSFVLRRHDTVVGMNFDNDGKPFAISTGSGNGFLVSVQANGRFFPSFGVTMSGTFVNDLMVDPTDNGRYKRQNDKRWITTTLVSALMEDRVSLADLRRLLVDIEIVNGPKSSTHNMIVDVRGNTCVVEPGRGSRFTARADSDSYVMTNFPLTAYQEIQPLTVSGTGSDRYLAARALLSERAASLSEDDAFRVLQKTQQEGPDWKTELSLVYNASSRRLRFCLDRDYETALEYQFAAGAIMCTQNRESTRLVSLTTKRLSGVSIRQLLEEYKARRTVPT